MNYPKYCFVIFECWSDDFPQRAFYDEDEAKEFCNRFEGFCYVKLPLLRDAYELIPKDEKYQRPAESNAMKNPNLEFEDGAEPLPLETPEPASAEDAEFNPE